MLKIIEKDIEECDAEYLSREKYDPLCHIWTEKVSDEFLKNFKKRFVISDLKYFFQKILLYPKILVHLQRYCILWHSKMLQ